MNSWLDQTERRRAEAFRFEHHRLRFVASHAQLRDVLARYLGTQPEALAFADGPHGKPALVGAPLAFSLSHSGTRALIAVAREDIGVDLEELRTDIDLDDLGGLALSPPERGRLAGTGATAFLRHWTRKEAYLKACGIGLALWPAAFEVTPAGVGDSGVWWVPGQAEWRIHDLDPDPTCVGALAVPASGFCLTLLDWTPAHGC